LTNDLLDLSRVESGHLELEQTEFDLPQLVEESAELLAARADEKGLELVCQVMPDVPTKLVGDPTRLRQILVNLIGNAVKFTERGEVVVRVGNDPAADGLPGLLVTVTDTGIGIPADKQEVIFERFNQADASTTRTHGGTGLGLTISRRLVELMGGRMWVASTVGQGSTFSFTVGLGLPPGPALPQPSATPDLRGLRALIVDDHPTNRMVLRTTLSGWGLVVAEAESGEGALVELHRARETGIPYQLLLLDARMRCRSWLSPPTHSRRMCGEVSRPAVPPTSPSR
jgi:two-component system, sensor histidine kinase and response regulator